METIYIGIVFFLFLLAVVDLFVGVSNDAVNFLNSAVGAKAASFKVIILVAAIGVFIGAGTSNGMMEIARHGIFHPEQFAFKELMIIFLAVMVTDVVLLDVFNSLGLPTSTTVSMVFELLGGTFALSLIKIYYDNTLSLGVLLNTDKAFSVIMGIFLSVAIAFVIGTVVQYLARLIFTFNYTKKLKYTIGIFGGIALTSIIYFVLVKGAKDLTFMTPEVKSWIHDHTLHIVVGSFVFFAIFMQILNAFKVNVFKIIVLAGTFALALAFAGNDLVNFVGVPIAGYSSFMDFYHNGSWDAVDTYKMGVLNAPAQTPIYFLIASGAVMVFALIKSKKARNVIQTSVNLSSQDESDEMFGSSRLARGIVRSSNNLSSLISKIVPLKVEKWIDSRFVIKDAILENGAAFDLVRASVNLVLSGLLIIFGTSLKLPLSTTYVTFMVAMGSSLADRAWGRESAVFRITGVVSVIGGWFITAGVAFTVCAFVALLMYWGGLAVMIVFIVVAAYILVRSQIKFSKDKKKEKDKKSSADIIVYSKNQDEVWNGLREYYSKSMIKTLDFSKDTYSKIIKGFLEEDVKKIRKANNKISTVNKDIKKDRRLMMIGLRRIDDELSIEKNTWFHLALNHSQQIMYSLKRVADPCEEHVDNNFDALPKEYKNEFLPIASKITDVMQDIIDDMKSGKYIKQSDTIKKCNNLVEKLTKMRRDQIDRLRKGDAGLRVLSVYLNMIQESRELVNDVKHLVRESKRFVN